MSSITNDTSKITRNTDTVTAVKVLAAELARLRAEATRLGLHEAAHLIACASQSASEEIGRTAEQ